MVDLHARSSDKSSSESRVRLRLLSEGPGLIYLYNVSRLMPNSLANIALGSPALALCLSFVAWLSDSALVRPL